LSFLVSESLKDRISEEDLIDQENNQTVKELKENFNLIMTCNNQNRYSFPIDKINFKKNNIALSILCFSSDTLTTFFHLNNNFLLQIACNNNISFQKKDYKNITLKSIEESLTRKCFIVTIIITV